MVGEEGIWIVEAFVMDGYVTMPFQMSFKVFGPGYLNYSLMRLIRGE